MSDDVEIRQISKYRLKPLDGLGRWASGLIVLAAGLSLFAALVGGVGLLGQNTGGQSGTSGPENSVASVLYGILAIGSLVFVLSGGVVFFFWVYRAAANVHAVHPAAMKIRPGWAVGWNFIPIAFFWKPFQAVRQIWRASHDIQSPDNVPVPAIFVGWWACWIAALFVNGKYGGGVVSIGLNAAEADGITVSDVVELILLAAACYFLAMIIREITQVQKTLASGTAGVFG